MDFVDSAQKNKGVHVDIENQLVTISLNKERALDLKEIAASIKKGGYEPMAFYLRVKGVAFEKEGQMFLKNEVDVHSFHLQGEKVNDIHDGGNYELQLIIDEEQIKSLQESHVLLAEVDRIIEEGVR